MVEGQQRQSTIIGLASIGGMLEFYDFVIFVFFADNIAGTFFPSNVAPWIRSAMTWGLFSAGYIARPIGGIVMAHLGDLYGRKRLFLFGVILMAAATSAIGILPGWSAIGAAAPLLLLVCRLVQGGALGGEVPGAWLFVSEHVSPRRVGLACGALTAGLTGGIFLGSIVNSLLMSCLTPAELANGGWRVAFLLGGVIGLSGGLLRRSLSETPVFEAMRLDAALARETPVSIILRQHRLPVAVSAMATWLLTAAVVVVVLMGPSLLRLSFALPADKVASANLAATAMLTIGCIVTGAAIDRMGLRTVCCIAGPVIAAGSVLLFRLGDDPTRVLPVYAVAGFLAGAITVTPVFMVRAFPAHIAYSGISLSYNSAYALAGGLTPPLVIALAHYGGVLPAIYVASVALVGSIAMLCWLPSTDTHVLV